MTTFVSTSTSPATNFVANVLLPVSILNMDRPSLMGSTQVKTCPHVNNPLYVPGMVPTELDIINGITNLPLTKFGSYLAKLIVGEFNTVYGTTFDPAMVTLKTDNALDQNSTCAYIVTINPELTITCYVQLSASVRVSFSLEPTDIPVASATSSTSTI
jgi:hypothetical protein